jgi:hypothetical protein
MLKKYPFHSFLIGLFPVIFIFVKNPGQVNWTDMQLPLVVMELIVGILLLIAYSISKNWAASGIFVSLLLVWFYSYGCFYNIFAGLTLNNVLLGRERWLIPIWGLLFVVGLVCLIKFRRYQSINKALNVVMSALVGLLLLNAGMSYYKPSGTERDVHGEIRSKTHRLITADPDNAKPKRLPSIYYIILDGYSAGSILKDNYGYDNVQFTSYLKNKGFYVAEKSCSNYPSTALSLSSSLNLDYLGAIFNLNGRKNGDIAEDIKWSIEYNEFAAYLSRRGYKIVKLGSWWSPTATEKGKTLASYVATEFNIAFLRTTLMLPIVDRMMTPLLRRETISIFDRLADLPRSDGPHFVFAHIICPHPPYVFGANGEEVGLSENVAMRLNPEMFYLNQVKYVNKRVELLINTLLKDSNSPPIIILQGDHGSGFFFHPMPDRNMNDIAEQDAKSILKAQFEILNAYYLPDGGEKYLYDGISPVNTFRVIINAYFGGHLELLPDLNYYSNHRTPYNFIDVTDKVKD